MTEHSVIIQQYPQHILFLISVNQ